MSACAFLSVSVFLKGLARNLFWPLMSPRLCVLSVVHCVSLTGVIALCVSVGADSPRVPNQNGVSLLYIMLEIHHSGQEPSNHLGCD